MCDFRVVAPQRYSEGLLFVRDVSQCMALTNGFFPRWAGVFSLKL